MIVIWTRAVCTNLVENEPVGAQVRVGVLAREEHVAYQTKAHHEIVEWERETRGRKLCGIVTESRCE